MGTWKGKAPLSNRGDWAHGALLQLKFNPHKSKNKKISGEDVTKVGEAYSLAIDMIEKAYECTQRASAGQLASYDVPDAFVALEVRQIFDRYFGANPDYQTILGTLQSTMLGLKDNSKDNRVYLFDSQSKPEDGGDNRTAGYVMGYPNNYKPKRHRPEIQSHEKGAKAGEKTPRRRGHIHVNYTLAKADLAVTVIHEATHRFAGTGDFAYEQEVQKWNDLSDAEKLNNADSFACFCRDVYQKLL